MLRTKIAAGSLLMLVLGSLCRAQNASLLVPGSYHSDEVTARSGELWLGLFPKEGGFELRYTRLKIQREADPILDEDGQTTGKLVCVDELDEPLFLVKAVPSMKAGPVQSVLATEERFRASSPIRLALASDRRYELGFRRNEEAHSCDLVLTLDGASQVLARYESCSQEDDIVFAGGDGDAHILWAGDLDWDGGLDLLLDVTGHYDLSAVTLFLSSGTRNGRLVRQVAQIAATGC